MRGLEAFIIIVVAIYSVIQKLRASGKTTPPVASPIAGSTPRTPLTRIPPIPTQRPVQTATGTSFKSQPNAAQLAAKQIPQSGTGSSKWGSRLPKRGQAQPAPESQAPMSDVALDFRAQQQEREQEFAEASEQAGRDATADQLVLNRSNDPADMTSVARSITGGQAFSNNPILNGIIFAQVLKRPNYRYK